MLALKMLRDMARHKTQFISVFLMAFLAIFIYAGVGGEWRGNKKSADDFYASSALADIWLYGAGFDEAQARAVAELYGVTAAERRLRADALAELDGAPKLEVYLVERGEISTPHIAEGAPLDLGDEDGIWPGKRFADAHGLSVGDALRFTVRGFPFEKTIRGLVYSPEHVFPAESGTLTPDFAAHGYAWMSSLAMPAGLGVPFNTLLLRTDGDVTEDEVSRALDGKYSVFLDRANHPSVSTFASEITQHAMMGGIFPVAFLLIALLTIVTTMTRIVTSQRIQIGTLKATGFKSAAITRHYIAYGFFLSLTGGALGLLTGPLVLPPLFYPSMSGFYTLPEWKPVWAPAFIVTTAALAFLCALVTWLSVRRLLRGAPAGILRPPAPKVFRHSPLERARLWRRFGFNAQWNLRDVSRNRVRSLMAVIGVLGCTALVVCALGMNASMEDIKVWQYETINRFESKLLLGETVSPARIADIQEATGGEAVMEAAIELRAGDVKKTGSLTVVDNVTLVRPTDTRRNPAALPEDGVSLTVKMANLLGVGAGDTVRWHIYGDEGWIDSKIAAIYRDPTAQGIFTSRAHLESLGVEFRPTALVSAGRVTDSFDGVDAVLSTADIVSAWEDLTESMYIMVYLLIAAAAVLSVVVLYNLGLLTFTEMEREMATLKVMGLKTRLLRGLLLTQNLWFSAIGFLLGVPCGLGLIKIMVDTSGESYDFPVQLHADTLLISFAFTFGLSVLVNLLFTRKIRSLNMVESLKAME